MAKKSKRRYSGSKSYSRPGSPSSRPSAAKTPSVKAPSVKMPSAKTPSAETKEPGNRPASRTTVVAPVVEERGSGEVDFRTEYRYVLSDLKHIGILAAAMFGTLIVLALVIH